MVQPVLTSIERYTRALADCENKAAVACSEEIQQLWVTIASSYRFLLDRENRIEAEERAHSATSFLSN